LQRVRDLLIEGYALLLLPQQLMLQLVTALLKRLLEELLLLARPLQPRGLIFRLRLR
jgi:hypothetical protein